MTRKHFVAIAEALRDSKPISTAHDDLILGPHLARRSSGWRIYQWEKDVRAMADVCASANPHFNRNRFYAACNYEGQGN